MPLRESQGRTYAVAWSTHLSAFGRVVLFLFLVSNFRRRRKLETKSESLPRCRRRKRRDVETTAYVLKGFAGACGPRAPAGAGTT